MRYKMLRRSQDTLTSLTLWHCNLVLIIILNLLWRVLIIILRLLLKSLIVILVFLELSLLSLQESERFCLLDLPGLTLLLWEVSSEDLLTVPSPALRELGGEASQLRVRELSGETVWRRIGQLSLQTAQDRVHHHGLHTGLLTHEPPHDPGVLPLLRPAPGLLPTQRCPAADRQDGDQRDGGHDESVHQSQFYPRIISLRRVWPH